MPGRQHRHLAHDLQNINNKGTSACFIIIIYNTFILHVIAIFIILFTLRTLMVYNYISIGVFYISMCDTCLLVIAQRYLFYFICFERQKGRNVLSPFCLCNKMRCKVFK